MCAAFLPGGLHAVVAGSAAGNDAGVAEVRGLPGERWRGRCRTPRSSGCGCGPLPAALVPLWQELQAAVTCAWSTRVAGFQPDHRVAGLAGVARGRCVAPLPVAFTPSWQLAQRLDDPGVVPVRGLPGGRRVARLAVVAAHDVVRRLAGRDGPVVAGEAAAGHLAVIDGRRGFPGLRRVAGRRSCSSTGCVPGACRSPSCRCGRSSSCRSPACDRRATPGASPWSSGRPGRHRWPGCGCCSCRSASDSVVAGDAARGDALVGESGRHPCARRVAAAAFRGRRDVARGLARRLHAVVAARAGLADARVVERRRLPRGR